MARSPTHLRNIDLTDREMLHNIASCITRDGYTTSADIADMMGIVGDRARSPAGRVSVRLAWMRRNGLIERLDPKLFGRKSKERLWAITPFGDQIMQGRLTKAVEAVIDRNDPGSSVLMMRELTRRAYVEASRELATAVRREYLHGIARRTR
jgi:hypothetical protein